MLIRLLIITAVLAGVLMVVTGQLESSDHGTIGAGAQETGEEVEKILQEGFDKRNEQIEAGSR